MKRLLSLLMLAWMCLSIYANDTDPINLVFIGNSITYGANLSDPANQAPPVKVAANVKNQTGRDVYYRNCGLSGSATPNWMPGQDLFTKADNAAKELQKAHKGELFFSMMLGTNDTHQGWKTSPETYYQNMKTIILELLRRHPEAHIIVNYPTWYSPNTHNGAVYLQEGLDRLKTYIPMITKLCDMFQKSERPQVWPGDPTVFSFFENKTEYFVAENGNSGVFYLHPNLTGGTKLAEFWTKSIIDHLGDIAPLHSSDELLLDKACETAAACMQVDKSTLNAANKLIGAGQLTTNGTASAGSKIENLTDMNPATYFEVDEKNSGLSKAPWMQVDLKGKAVENMVLTMQKRSDSNMPANHNWTPSDVTIYGSANGEEWERLVGLHGMDATKSSYVSPVLTVGNGYRYLRMTVNDTESLNLSEGGALTWNLSEVQLYSVKTDLANSPYTTIEGLKQACDELTECYKDCAEAFAAGVLTDEQRTALNNAIDKVKTLNKASGEGGEENPNIVYVNDLTTGDAYSFDKTKGVLKYTSQIKANSEEKNAGTNFSPANLLNKSTDYNTIIWHTEWISNPLPADVDNYLQAHLTSKQSDFCFTMVGSNWSSTYDTPDHMVILASNTPRDESSWVQICELPDMIPEELHDVHPAFYTSPRIDLGAEYSDIRFVVKATVNNRKNKNGNIYVSLARFQVYQPTAVESTVKQLEVLVEKMTEMSASIQVGTQPGCYPQEEADAFRQALETATLLVSMNPNEEEADAMITMLNATYEALEASKIVLNEGCYWIKSGHEGLKTVQGVEKALAATDGEDVQWTTFDANDATQAFNLKADGDNWKVQNLATGLFLGGADASSKRIAQAEDGISFSINAESNGMFSLNNNGGKVALETTRNDAMPQGYVVLNSPTQKSFGQWYLIPITDETKVQQLNAQASVIQVLKAANEAYYEAMGCGSREMLTDGSQLYANSEMSGFPVSNLLSKSTSYSTIIFHSIWGNGALPAGVDNYLQINLGEPQKNISFSMIGSSWGGTYDTPDDYVIMATDTPEDEASWKVVTELHDMIPQTLHTTYPAFYTSPIIDLGGEYTHLRFMVKSTVNNRSNGNGNIYFSLARFQVYGNAENPKYNTMTGLAAAVDDMVALRDEIKAADIDNVTPEQVADLQKKVELVLNIMNGTGINSASTALPKAVSNIYNLAGQRMGKSQQGINIVQGRKIAVK